MLGNHPGQSEAKSIPHPFHKARNGLVALYQMNFFCFSSNHHEVNSVHQFVRLVSLLGYVLVIFIKSPNFWYLFLTSQSLAPKSLRFSGYLMAVGIIKLM